jgi:hypothetical protein
VWSKAARLRRGRAVRPASPGEWEARRVEWVRTNAPGRSFVDVGGLFKLMGDMAFLAEEVGATQVTLLDVGDSDLPAEGHLEWGDFESKRVACGSTVRYVQGGLEEPVSPERIGVHDVVFYSGVLYQTPNPVLQLLQLRRITGELLYLSTLAIPEVPGFPQVCVYYPYLEEEDRAPFRAGYHWSGDLLGIGRPVDERPMYGYGNCYWGITRSALLAVPVAPFAIELVCRPLPLHPLLPPAVHFRERQEARERGQERLPFADLYDQRRARGAI